ncbi:MAG: hypothetical protein K0S44_248 [Bacteroidetes bacterium]|jgi:hypothetical protein|nr:hypothetical protein [Bacteroidota bacterium]
MKGLSTNVITGQTKDHYTCKMDIERRVKLPIVQIASVSITSTDHVLIKRLEAVIHREVNKFNKNQ